MADPIADLAARFDDLDRRLHALETAPRAPLTSIDSGGLTIAAGGSLTVPNPDGTGIVLGVDAGERINPLSVGVWTPWAPLKSSTLATSYIGLFACTIMLGTAAVSGSFDFEADGGGTADFRLTAEAIGGQHAGTPTGPVTLDEWTGVTSLVQYAGTWAVPSTLWTPNAHPGGSLVRFTIEGRHSTGAFEAAAYVDGPLLEVA